MLNPEKEWIKALQRNCPEWAEVLRRIYTPPPDDEVKRFFEELEAINPEDIKKIDFGT
jgi:hypothetical protein